MNKKAITTIILFLIVLAGQAQELKKNEPSIIDSIHCSTSMDIKHLAVMLVL